MAELKLVREMTPVELLSEFCRNREYHEAVAEARAFTASDEAKPYGEPRVDHHGVWWLWWKRAGRPIGEVHEPSPEQDRRWTELCAEINRRFTPPRPPFTGPYK